MSSMYAQRRMSGGDACGVGTGLSEWIGASWET